MKLTSTTLNLKLRFWRKKSNQEIYFSKNQSSSKNWLTFLKL